MCNGYDTISGIGNSSTGVTQDYIAPPSQKDDEQTKTKKTTFGEIFGNTLSVPTLSINQSVFGKEGGNYRGAFGA